MRKLELSMAWRYMRSRRGSRLLSLISVIAVGGVMVGVSALIVVTGVMNGMQRDLRDKILVASPDIRILPWGQDLVMADWRLVMEKVRKDPGVVAVQPFALFTAILSRSDARFYTPVTVVGLSTDTTAQVTTIRQMATAGDFSFMSGEGERRGVLLGERLAGLIGATPGITEINLLTANPSKVDPVSGAVQTHSEKYLVTGLFKTGMYEYDNGFLFMALPAAQQLAGLDTMVTGLEVRTPSREVAPEVGLRLADSLGSIGGRIEDWQHQNAALFSALKLEKVGMTLILLLIVLVAAFNIVGTLSMVVADKTREIGILRAMGMRARSIRNVFFIQGMIIGGVGTLGGAVLGLVSSYVIDRYELIKIDTSVYFIDHLPVATQVGDVIAILTASMIITALATIYPARQAAALYPVEAIRHE